MLISSPPDWSAVTPEVLPLVTKGCDLLRSRPGVRRVWLFGSSAAGRPLDERSDLDFAVEGLPAVEHYKTHAALENALQFPCDLVRWEEAPPVLRNEIVTRGLLLDEKT